MKIASQVPAIFLRFFFVSYACAAQSIHVDITPGHATNHFVPNQALGAGVDRIPQEAIDKDLVRPALDRALSSGWQPAKIPVALLYDTPDDAAAEMANLQKRGYPVSYVEMGEAADGQYMLPEDDAALFR